MNSNVKTCFFSLESRIWNIKISADIDPKYDLFVPTHIIYISQTFILLAFCLDVSNLFYNNFSIDIMMLNMCDGLNYFSGALYPNQNFTPHRRSATL